MQHANTLSETLSKYNSFSSGKYNLVCHCVYLYPFSYLYFLLRLCINNFSTKLLVYVKICTQQHHPEHHLHNTHINSLASLCGAATHNSTTYYMSVASNSHFSSIYTFFFLVNEWRLEDKFSLTKALHKTAKIYFLKNTHLKTFSSL